MKFILSALVALPLLSYSQQFRKASVESINLQDVGTLQQGNKVVGYYFFYPEQKIDKRLRSYRLTITNEDLVEKNSTTIERPKDYLLIEACSNGSYFAFLFFDWKSKKLEILTFDSILNQHGQIYKEVKNVSALGEFDDYKIGQGVARSLLVPVNKEGFIYYGIQNGPGKRYDFEFLDNRLNRIWSSRAPESKKNDVEMATEAAQNKNYIVSIIEIKRKSTARSSDYVLVVNSKKEGTKIFETPLNFDEYEVSPSNVKISVDERSITVLGELYPVGSRQVTDPSIGVAFLRFDFSGNLLSKKYNSWAKDISSVMPLDQKGRFLGLKSNVLFHETIQTSDGRIFMIGELYKKSVSGEGVALQALGLALGVATGVVVMPASSVKLTIYDLVVFEFDSLYNPVNVHLFPKQKKGITMMASGSGFLTAKELSYYTKSMGGFDFSFVQSSSSNDSFTITYLDFDKSAPDNQNVVGSIYASLETGFVVKKTPVKKVYYNCVVRPAKEGYVMVTEYSKSESLLESRLEKVIE